MKDLKAFDIKFLGLKLGEHSFDFQLNDEFFDLFGYDEFENARITARVGLVKKENSLEFTLITEGQVIIPCDITNEPFDLPVANEIRLVVKFGDEYDDSNEDLLIIPHGEHTVNIGQYLYEAVVLSIPLKRISPAVENGEKGQEILAQLERYEEQRTSDRIDEDDQVDPRWEQLKKLLE